MKRSAHENLARRLGIRMTQRTPGLWGASTLVRPLTAYRFEFPALLHRPGQRIWCRPGVRFYATTLGAATDAEAWKLAIDQFREAIRP